MAWSDAARAAALEVRRAHAAYKQEYRRQKTAFNLSADTTRSGRKYIANNLRALRRGPIYSTAGMHEMASEAAASTRLRNLKRLAKAKRRK